MPLVVFRFGLGRSSLQLKAGQRQLGLGEKAVLRHLFARDGPTLGLAEALTARLRPNGGLLARWIWRTKFCGLDKLVLPSLGTV
jgi:hypothetical protein